MNRLARVIHALVVGDQAMDLGILPPLERAVLADIQPLIRRTPSQLATYLADKRAEGGDWMTAIHPLDDRILL